MTEIGTPLAEPFIEILPAEEPVPTAEPAGLPERVPLPVGPAAPGLDEGDGFE
jgi:hypothetical protein